MTTPSSSPVEHQQVKHRLFLTICIAFQKQILFVFAIFQRQIRFYSTFSNFVSGSQTIKTYFSILFFLEIRTLNYNLI
jgi:hypothetical protein